MDKIMITLLIQTTIEAETEEEYEQKRDQLTERLEKEGFLVNIEDESSEEDLIDPDDDDVDW